jgi:hypothetical protein
MSNTTKICEVCGVEVANLQYKKHVAAHSTKEVRENKMPSIPENASAEIKELMNSALAAQNKMLESPNAFLGEDSSDHHMALRKVHCPETLGDNAEWEAIFGDASKRLDGYTARGYIPVLDEKANIVRDEGGHPLFKILRKIYDGRKDVYRKESERRLEEVTQSARQKGIGGMATAGDVRYFEDELSIKKTGG